MKYFSSLTITLALTKSRASRRKDPRRQRTSNCQKVLTKHRKDTFGLKEVMAVKREQRAHRKAEFGPERHQKGLKVIEQRTKEQNLQKHRARTK